MHKADLTCRLPSSPLAFSHECIPLRDQYVKTQIPSLVPSSVAVPLALSSESPPSILACMVSLWNTEPALATWAALTALYFTWIPKSSYQFKRTSLGSKLLPNRPLSQPHCFGFQFCCCCCCLVVDDDGGDSDGDVLDGVSYRSG